MKRTLMEKLSSMSSATPQSVNLLVSLFVPVRFKKGMLFTAPGHSFPTLYFIETGLLRAYFLHNMEEHTCWILEQGFLMPLANVNETDEAVEYIEFLRDTTGWSLNLSKAEALAQTEPLMYRILFDVYQANLRDGKARELMLRLHTADERMAYAKMSYGKLIDKVLHPVLASFLNIETKYLYKIMKKRGRG